MKYTLTVEADTREAFLAAVEKAIGYCRDWSAVATPGDHFNVEEALGAVTARISGRFVAPAPQKPSGEARNTAKNLRELEERLQRYEKDREFGRQDTLRRWGINPDRPCSVCGRLIGVPGGCGCSRWTLSTTLSDPKAGGNS